MKNEPVDLDRLMALHADAEPDDGGPWGAVAADDRSWRASAWRWGSASHEAFPALVARARRAQELDTPAMTVPRRRAKKSRRKAK